MLAQEIEQEKVCVAPATWEDFEACAESVAAA